MARKILQKTDRFRGTTEISYFDYCDRFKIEFRRITNDLAFLREFDENLKFLEKIEDDTLSASVGNLYITYRDSLFLGTSRMADSGRDHLSLSGFDKLIKSEVESNKHHKFGSNCPLNTDYNSWLIRFEKWKADPRTHSLRVYRTESLAHNIKYSNDRLSHKVDYRSLRDSIANLDYGPECLISHSEKLARLVSETVALLGHSRYQLNHYGVQGAAEKEFEELLSRYRTEYRALLFKLSN